MKKIEFIKWVLSLQLQPQQTKDLNKENLKKEWTIINKVMLENQKNYLNVLGSTGLINSYLCPPKFNHKQLNSEKKEYYLKNQIQKLQFILSKIFNIEVEFDLQELRYNYFNSAILAKNIKFYNKKSFFTVLTRKIFRHARLKRSQYFLSQSLTKHIKYGLPYQIVGLQIKLSGRWIRERTKPKKTKQLLQFGPFGITQTNYSTNNVALGKNKKGSFNISVKTTAKNINYLDKKKKKINNQIGITKSATKIRI